MTAVSVGRADLAWALRAVLPHAARPGDPLTELAAVRIEADRHGTVYLAATDRYTIAAAWIRGRHGDTPGGGDQGALVGVQDARELSRRLRADDDGECDLEFYADGELAVDYRVRYQPASSHGFPDWRKLLARALHGTPAVPAEGQGLNPAYLGRFTTGRRPGCPALTFMPVNGRGSSMLLVSVLGAQFAGAVIGVRMNASDLIPASLLRADWLARTGAAA